MANTIEMTIKHSIIGALNTIPNVVKMNTPTANSMYTNRDLISGSSFANPNLYAMADNIRIGTYNFQKR